MNCRSDHFGEATEMVNMVQRSCETVKQHLGAGACRINLESEGAAGEYEAWEPKEQRAT